MMRITRKEHGYTLVEVVVVIVLLGILATTAFYGLLSGVDIYIVTTRDYLNLFQSGRIALEKMARELRETNPDSITISTGDISFNKQSDHVTPLDSSESIRFYQSDDEIRREGNVSGTRVLLSRIQVGSFTPSQDANGVVTISFTVEGDGSLIPLETSILPRVPN